MARFVAERFYRYGAYDMQAAKTGDFAIYDTRVGRGFGKHIALVDADFVELFLSKLNAPDAVVVNAL